ncbi:helix-turn-helix protein [Actinomadura pelletieri DSM 43383]|uniref:Helix-turn-helix protein n=1 Tax=Actinomadura pelletieri DSM 43383 TaxID=1120940 RepID=A0A495Q8W8_9ACTN|nr:helix-turn-helix transcriptional regulator [Actinomadura pelletieri]RKS67697.1 helix-turn-helix protein [Actinomadura pelletieri DSM 43383]
MGSPYVKRLRLAAELRALREDRGLMAEELAKRIHYSRTKISRLENASGRPDVGDVLRVLDALGLSDDECMRLVRLATAASKKGWWDAYGESMGPRQRLYADIESGADTIREYNGTMIPGLLQTAEYSSALAELWRGDKLRGLDFKKMTKARQRRQEAVLHPEGPAYTVILDEVVLRRVSVPADVLAAQIRHLIKLMASVPKLGVRVLPVDANVEGVAIPEAAFSLYTFPNSNDPPMVMIETSLTDLPYTGTREVEQHAKRYELLGEVVLSSEGSLKCLTEAADRLSGRTGG